MTRRDVKTGLGESLAHKGRDLLFVFGNKYAHGVI
jgi:hypothetical protein